MLPKPRGTASVPHPLQMSALLRQLGRELASLQDMTSRLEASIDEIIERHAGAFTPETIRNLQLLDIVGQTLSALSLCCGTAAPLADPRWIINGRTATAGLPLASLAARLARGAREGGDNGEQADGGYEMFGDA